MLFKLFYIAFSLLFISSNYYSQKPNEIYLESIKIAFKLKKQKKFINAAVAYNNAFYSNGGKGLSGDRFDAAICWVGAGRQDSAFKQLNIILRTYNKNTDKILLEPSFFPLQDKSEWNIIKEKVELRKHEYDELIKEFNIDGKLIKSQQLAMVGKEVPFFSFTDINGNKFSSDSLKGKTVVLNFWATWCKPCIKEIPFLNKIADEFSKKRIVFISFCLNADTISGFKKIIDEFILSSTNDMSLTSAIRNIDFEAAKLGISFYQMIFILIQKESSQNRKKKL